MDYYQGVVSDYLRADRSIFLNTEFCLQKNAAANPDGSGPHWYVDAVAVSFRERRIYLCEITYAKGLSALLKRLSGWNEHWADIRAALIRDAALPAEWPVRPWLFVPEALVPSLASKLEALSAEKSWSFPLVTTLEMTQPWQYRSWHRPEEARKPDAIPTKMQT
jgi:hypothetical protein